MLINEHNYPELYEFTERLKKELNMKDIKVLIVKDKILNGTAVNSKKITLTGALIEAYNDKPEAVNYMLAHELIHIKNKEYANFKSTKIKLKALFSKKYRAVILMQEMRAAIEGANLAKLTSKEIQSSQIFLHIKNKGKRKQKTYNEGYPSRVQIIKFAQKYSIFTANVASEILSDYEQTVQEQYNHDDIKKILFS